MSLLEICLSLFSGGLEAERPGFDSTQPTVQCEPRVKYPGREGDHLPPSSQEVKPSGAILPISDACLWRGVISGQLYHYFIFLLNFIFEIIPASNLETGGPLLFDCPGVFFSVYF